MFSAPCSIKASSGSRSPGLLVILPIKPYISRTACRTAVTLIELESRQCRERSSGAARQWVVIPSYEGEGASSPPRYSAPVSGWGTAVLGVLGMKLK